MNNIETAKAALRSVLCDPEGVVCIRGSDEDRRVVQEALATLDAAPSVRVPAEESAAHAHVEYGQPHEWAEGWNACRAEVLRLNAPPQETVK